MAEIKVEKKKKSSILPWILGLALLALVVWGLSQMGDRDDDRAENAENQGAALQSIEQSAPITFVDFVDAIGVRAA